jgi:hypothetical protein
VPKVAASRDVLPKSTLRTSLHARYDKDGPRNQPFHPAVMVKVLVYGCLT